MSYCERIVDSKKKTDLKLINFKDVINMNTKVLFECLLHI